MELFSNVVVAFCVVKVIVDFDEAGFAWVNRDNDLIVTWELGTSAFCVWNWWFLTLNQASRVSSKFALIPLEPWKVVGWKSKN